MSDKPETRNILNICDEAMELGSSERRAFLEKACGNDNRLRESVESVLRAITAAGHFLTPDDDSMLPDKDWIGEYIGNFKILDQLGEGGMGSVFLAEREQDDYTQRVALKMIRSRFLANELIDRFNAERQILAGLNHPYIAALIDGGTTPEGMPYLVMEYIEGQPVDEYCDRRSLGIEARIELIQKIAMAVQSAHQNLVVHRDLKPSNVLVTADGIPKLLDFGIAKLMQPDESSDTGSTALYGRPALTPDYASPEQILENKVTTASDVYSLGVLTYTLLTGERPYSLPSGSRPEMISSVEALSVPRPSTRLDTIESSEVVARIAACRDTTAPKLKRTLSGDIDNVLLKALHKEPERRYVSVAAFSADLGRFLSGMPVEARPDSLGYRAQRFVARNRIAVTASSALALTIVAALAVSSWAYFRAEAANAEATQRFDQVRSIANIMMFDIYEQIEKVPGTNSARETLAATAQEYLETLVASDSAPPDLVFEAAIGYSRLSSIMNKQVVSDTANREIGQQAWEKSLALLTDLTTRHEDRAAVYKAVGELHTSRAQDMLYIDNAPVESREQLELAAEAFAEAQRIAPDDPEIVAERLTAQRFLADSFRWQNNYEEAANLIEPLLQEVSAATERWPDNTSLLKTSADIYQLSGRNHWFSDTFAEGIVAYTKAVELYEKVQALDGPDQAIDELIADTRWSRGNSYFDLEQPEQSAIDYAAAIDLIAVQAARDPNDASTGRRLAILRASQAAVIVKLGQADEALTLMNETNDWFEAQAKADPDTPDVQRSVGVSYMMMANILLDAQRKDDACEWYERTRNKWLEIDAQFGLSEFDADQPERLTKILQEEDC